MRSRASYYLGEMAKARNDAPALLHHAEEALRALRLSPKRTQRMQATFVALQGYACHLDGRNDEADRHYTTAIATLESLGLGSSPNAIAHHYNWGVIRQNMGDLDRSLELLDSALAKAARAAPDAPPSPIHLGHRSRTLELMGRHQDAEASYRVLLALALAQGSARMAFLARLGLASTCAGRGQAAEAHAWLEQARNESTVPPAPGTSAAVLEHLVEGRLALLGNDPAAAVAAFSEAMARRPPIAPTVLALVGRAEAHLALSRRDAAEVDAADALGPGATAAAEAPHQRADRRGPGCAVAAAGGPGPDSSGVGELGSDRRPERLQPAWAAAFRPAMSIFTIFSIASITRRRPGGVCSISPSTGRICQHAVAVAQPAALLRRAAAVEERVPVAVDSAWSSQLTMNEMAWLNGSSGPAHIA